MTHVEPAASTDHLIAVPFDPARGPADKIPRLFQWFEAHPLWFATGADPEEIRLNIAWAMSDPACWKWEVWSGGDFVGMLLLTNVVPRLDATFHFTTWGTNLFRFRKLIWNFWGYVFEHFDLRRISVEVPDHERKLLRFYRDKLCVRFENEVHLDSLPVVQFLMAPGHRGHMPDAPVWVARQGSRREQAHFDGKRWRDLLLLRLFRTEYETRCSLEALSQATREPSVSEASDVAARDARPIPV